jgi:hypothetical protein
MSLDVLRARVAFRERAFIDVMDLALRFLVVHWRLYAKVAAVVLVPSIVLTLGLAHLASDWWIGWAVALALSFAVQVPFTLLASRLVFQDQVSARVVLRAAARELPRILAMRVLWVLPITLGWVLLVIPAIGLGALFLFVDEVMILERSRIIPAFGRSQRIATSSMGNTLLCVAMVTLLPLVAVLFADVGGRALVSDLLQFRGPAPLWTTGGSVLAVVGWFGVIPYVATARFFAYLNVRTRAEGWDIQTRFAAIAARAEQEVAT